MPQISTPESLLPRSDSLDPASTCRGITSQGRPCRRSLAPSPASTPKKGKKPEVQDPTSFYCWQHQDQAVAAVPSQSYDAKISLKPRSSIDTLMDRLGVLEIKDDKPPPKLYGGQTYTSGGEYRRPRPKSTFCCFTISEEEDFRPAKPVQRPQSQGRPTPQKVQGPPRPTKSSPPSAWVPSTLNPEITSTLLSEVTKPISDADEDGYIYMFWLTPSADAKAPLPRDIAKSVLPQHPMGNDSLRPPTQSRSVSDALRAAEDLNAMTTKPTSTTPGTIRLKIGRTSNVHRRMNEWTRQCAYDLTLIRYYPYTPSSSASSSPARNPVGAKGQRSHSDLVPGRKVPHVHRVERLIHLELDDVRLRDLGKCSECGKEHREWFEIEATKESLRRVDECVRRWVAWAESH
ncbi:hypothetical protein N7495_000935 [Penicillium taxi]|uniref:uncharacterized protein n=1 Tax=Penicillium taxi TaxID=168475 RepID=UPI0025454B2C|nr:uncharacterized protein N7495_000935 [Penicillium taxi]KAJ5908253.1 hypothetical protein N7495_000935 [Penicillium taxi]